MVPRGISVFAHDSKTQEAHVTRTYSWRCTPAILPLCLLLCWRAWPRGGKAHVRHDFRWQIATYAMWSTEADSTRATRHIATSAT